MVPLKKGPTTAMQALLADLHPMAESGDVDAMFSLAGLLANLSVELQDATMLNEAEHWFVTAAAGNQSAARDFVTDEWPIVKDFFRNQIAPHAA